LPSQFASPDVEDVAGDDVKRVNMPASVGPGATAFTQRAGLTAPVSPA